MILFFYNLALLAVLLLGLPWWLWRMATAAKYREGLRQRLGRVPEGLRGGEKSNSVPMLSEPVLWLHAVSVGEVLAASRLVAELEQAFPSHRLLISTTTRTGQALARERFGANRVFYCPLDLPWAVKAYLDDLQPKMLILAETEFWPNLLSGCFRRGIPVAVVNARISDRSWPRYRALRGLWKPFLSRLSLVLAQSELDAERLKTIGCAPERVSVAGNLKFDVRAAGESEATRDLKARGAGLDSGLDPGLDSALGPLPGSGQALRFLVAGSTLEGEESALLEAWPLLLEADSSLILVLAPRHPERFAAVAALLDSSGFAVPHVWTRRSAWKEQSAAASEPFRPGQIVLLDTIGELASVYSLASVAFIGGSLIPAGGHNPLEPAQFAVPIVMGPSYENFRAIVDDLQAHDAIRILEKGKPGRQELAAALLDLFRDRPAAKAMGERARQVFERQSGATARSVEAIRVLLKESA
jgi:3-deoxy-D-manno-octulosonic-acid transferase